MNARAWSLIYDGIEEKKQEIAYRRGKRRSKGKGTTATFSSRGRDGIFVMRDRLAVEFQRLDRIQHHVGLHFCAANDREHGMKSAKCFLVNP